MKKRNKIVFAFVDEIMTVSDNVIFFGVGVFYVKNKIFEINQKLRNVYLDAINLLRHDEKSFEFKFKYITPRSLPFYEKIILLLKKYQNNWDFDYLIKEKNEKIWMEYNFLLTKIFTKKKNDFFVLADYINKPKESSLTLEDLKQTTSILEILQIESQGTVFLQIADILLGGLVYKGSDEYKKEVSRMIISLIKNKSR